LSGWVAWLTRGVTMMTLRTQHEPEIPNQLIWYVPPACSWSDSGRCVCPCEL